MFWLNRKLSRVLEIFESEEDHSLPFGRQTRVDLLCIMCYTLARTIRTRGEHMAVVGPAVFTTGAKRLTELNKVWGLGVENDGCRSRKLRRTADAITCRVRGARMATLPAARYAVVFAASGPHEFSTSKTVSQNSRLVNVRGIRKPFPKHEWGWCSKSRTTHVLSRVACNFISSVVIKRELPYTVP